MGLESLGLALKASLLFVSPRRLVTRLSFQTLPVGFRASSFHFRGIVPIFDKILQYLNKDLQAKSIQQTLIEPSA